MTPLLRTRIGPKGQAVIPKPLRDKLGLRPGDELEVREDHGKIILEKRNARQAWEELFSVVPTKKVYPKGHDWDSEYEESYGR